MAKSTRSRKSAEESAEPAEPQMGGAAGGGRVNRKASKKDREPLPGKLNGSVWEGGRGYNPGDEREFAKLNLKKETLQSLANQKVTTDHGVVPLIEGFGVEPDEDEEVLEEEEEEE